MKTAKSYQMIDDFGVNLSPNVNIESIYYEENVNGRINRRSIYNHFPVYINYNNNSAIDENTSFAFLDDPSILPDNKSSYMIDIANDGHLYVSGIKESPIPNTIYYRIDVSTYDLTEILSNYAPSKYTQAKFDADAQAIEQNRILHIDEVIGNDITDSMLQKIHVNHEVANYDESTTAYDLKDKSIKEVLVDILFSNKNPEILFDYTIDEEGIQDTYVIDGAYQILYGYAPVSNPTYGVSIDANYDIHASFKNAIVTDEDVHPYEKVFASLSINEEMEEFSYQADSSNIYIDASVFLDAENPIREYTLKIGVQTLPLSELTETIKSGRLEDLSEDNIVEMYVNDGFVLNEDKFEKTILEKPIKVKFRMPLYFMCGHDGEDDEIVASNIGYFDIEDNEVQIVGKQSQFIQDKTQACHIFIPSKASILAVDSFKMGQDAWVELNPLSTGIDVHEANGTEKAKFVLSFPDENGAEIIFNENWKHYVINPDGIGIRQISFKIKLNED